MKPMIARLFSQVSLLFIFACLIGCQTQVVTTPESTATPQPSPTITASPTAQPTATAIPPTETPLPTATAIPPTETLVPTATPAPTQTPQPTPTQDVTANWEIHRDPILNVKLLLPEGWSAETQNNTTTYIDPTGNVAFYTREYFNRFNSIEATALIKQIAPPAVRNQLILDRGRIDRFHVYQLNNDLYIRSDKRMVHVVPVAIEDELLSTIVATYDGRWAPSVRDISNHNFVTSETWVAELRGGGTQDQTLTAQKRDGSVSWEIYFQEGVRGSGYSLNRPLLIDSAERFLYHQRVGISDGGGSFAFGGNIQRFDLTTGESIELADTNGSGHRFSADNQSIAFIQLFGDKSQLVLQDLTTGSRQTFPLDIEGENPSAGGLLFSAESNQIIFAAEPVFMGDGWMYGVTNFDTGETQLFPAPNLDNYLPADWQDNVITLQRGGNDKTLYLDLDWGTITTDVPVAKPNLEGLVLDKSKGLTQERWIVRDGSEQTLTDYELAKIRGNRTNYWSAFHQDKAYFVRNNDVVRVAADGSETVIETERVEQYIYGVVGDWLLVSSFPADNVQRQMTGALTAIGLNSVAYRVINERISFDLPIVAPDGSSVFYSAESSSYQWKPDNSLKPMRFGWFHTGTMSPDGNYLALIKNAELHIVHLESGETTAIVPFITYDKDAPIWPAWHPDSTHVAFDIWKPLATRVVSIDGEVDDIEGVSFPIFSPNGNWLAAIINAAPTELVIVDWRTKQQFETPYQHLPIVWINEAGTVETPQSETPNLDGLVFGSQWGTHDKWIVKDGSPVPLSEYESAQLLGQNAFTSAAHDGISYIIRDGDVVMLDGSSETIIETDRIEYNIFGIVGDWLIVSSTEPDTIIGAAIGTLTAIALDGSDYQMINDDMYGSVPIIAPDGSRLFYALGDDTYQWLPTGEKQKMWFGAFRGGSISPDGNYLALVIHQPTVVELHIYNLSSQELVATAPMIPTGGHAFTIPVIWHPASTHVAIDHLNQDHSNPSGIRIVAVDDGATRDLVPASNAVFSPDGNWLAAYAMEDGLASVIINWRTGERHETPFNSFLLAWSD